MSDGKPVLWESSDTEGYRVFVSSLTTEYDPATNTVKLTFHEESDTGQGVTIVRVNASYLPGMAAHLRSAVESLERLRLVASLEGKAE